MRLLLNLFIFIIAFMAVGGFIADQHLHKVRKSQIQAIIPPDFEILVEHYFEGWMYIVTREPDGFLNVGASYKEGSGVRHYYLNTQQMAEELFATHETADVYVYFRHPLLENELPPPILEALDQVKMYSIRNSNGRGEYIWSGGEQLPVEMTALEREQFYAQHLQQVYDPDGTLLGETPYQVDGFMQLVVTVTKEQYQALLIALEGAIVDIGPALALAEAGFGTHSSERISFFYPLYSPSDEEIEIIETLQ